MKVATLRFSEIEVKEQEIIHFPQGLPGFEALARFVIIKPDPELPFSFLQSIDDGDIAFILTDPFLFFQDYEFEIPEPIKQDLRIHEEKDVMVWTIVSIKESLTDATANLLAPVILNVREQLGKQVILQNTSYRTKHPLLTAENPMPPMTEEDGHASASSQKG